MGVAANDLMGDTAVNSEFMYASTIRLSEHALGRMKYYSAGVAPRA